MEHLRHLELVALRERIEHLSSRIEELERDFLANPDVPSLWFTDSVLY